MLWARIGSSARDSKTVSNVNICPLKRQSGQAILYLSQATEAFVPMWLMSRCLSKTWLGECPIRHETSGHSLLWKRGTRRAASTWINCQHLAAGGTGWQAEAEGTLLLQNKTCSGQQASAQPLGYFCSFLGLQRSFSESIKSPESQLLLVFLLFQAFSTRLVSPCDALNLHTFQWSSPKISSIQISLDMGKI